MVRTRFAPSPTGDLHVGGAWTALASDHLARAAGGVSVLRMEDLDPPRVVPGAEDRILDDLAWLGLRFDEGPREGGVHAPYTQSRRFDRYAEALASLDAAGLVYPCDCSRAEIARAASAPHAGEEVVYPGTCRDLDPGRPMKRAPAARVRVPAGLEVTFEDLVRGPVTQRVDTAVGDFVLRRGDGLFAYQLAVAVDDAAMQITHVVRADDLLGSTPRQIWLMRSLGMADVPRYAHVPMVVAPGGERLAKRASATSVRELARRGVSAGELRETLSEALGLTGKAGEWRRDPWPVPASWV
ncbi:MAG: glutamyl-Q-tRNA synthetase [Labilithrix sp.]|nr:glutamyl-Q-tRNA synthetase [Labilithrix sp.]